MNSYDVRHMDAPVGVKQRLSFAHNLWGGVYPFLANDLLKKRKKYVRGDAFLTKTFNKNKQRDI